MSSADAGALDVLMRLLAGHLRLAYLLLFLGSLVETVLPFALLVPGEVVFLAGAMLAGMQKLDLLGVSVVLVGGGLAGDHASYWIGRLRGPGLLARLQRVPGCRRLADRRQRARARAFMRQRGAPAVFLARFAGPVSWLTPMLAGIGRMRYARFTRYNAPAVVLGIGQFIVVGYLAGRHGPALLGILRAHAWIVLPALVLAAALAWGFRRWRRRVACAGVR